MPMRLRDELDAIALWSVVTVREERKVRRSGALFFAVGHVVASGGTLGWGGKWRVRGLTISQNAGCQG